LLGLFAFAGILMLCVFIYKKSREKEEKISGEKTTQANSGANNKK
jgi:hypothetical protein